MKFSFIKDTTKDKEKKKMNDEIQTEAGRIARLVIMRKLTEKELSKIERLYAEYFKKYPDVEGEANAQSRMRKLKSIL